MPGPLHVVEDLVANLQPKLHKAQLEHSQVKAQAKVAIQQAALKYAEQLPKKGTTIRTVPARQPSVASSVTVPTCSWIMKLHPSHRLWAAGGLAFCSSCGAVSAGGRKTRLSLLCGSRPGKVTTRPKLIGEGRQAKTMPGGSEWRTRKLLAGTLVGKSRWPNGVSKEVTIIPARVFPHPRVPTNQEVGNTQEQSSEEVEDLLPLL